MQAKTIWKLIGVLVLLYVAAQPIGQIFVAVAGILTTIGDFLIHLGIHFQGVHG